jgi:ADP-heptose:LPS heptosyltransferase
VPPADDVGRARTLLGTSPRPWVGIHASGGRESKQWHLDRFAAVGRALARDRGATIVLTGSTTDRPLIDRVRAALTDASVIDAGGAMGLTTLAALVGELDLFITGDTGPMHLAAAMHTPVVALFGPSNPARYGPRASVERILRIDLPCSPCGQVRLPPERCRGHVPDCLDGISVDAVVAAALDVLDRSAG